MTLRLASLLTLGPALFAACGHTANQTAEPAPVVAAAVVEPPTDAASVEAGRALFEVNCAACHRADAGGVIGPNLTDRAWLHGGSPSQVLATIAHGVPARGMPTWGQILDAEAVGQLAAYVLSLRGTNPPDPKAPQGTEGE